MPQMYSIPKPLDKTPYKARFIAGSSSCTTTKLSKLITNCFRLLKNHCHAYCKTILQRTGVNSMWIINNSLDVLRILQDKRLSLNKLRTWDFQLNIQAYRTPNLNFNCRIYWKEFLAPEKRASLQPITTTLSGRMIRSRRNTVTFLVENCAVLLTFLSTQSTSVSEIQFFGKLLVYQWALTVRHYWLISGFLHTFEYDFMLKTMKQDISKAVTFSNTVRYIDDLFSVNNANIGNCILEIYPSELELKNTTVAENEVCYLDTKIIQGDDNTPFRVSVYDKRDDFSFRIVNFPHMDSNIPAKPAYGVYISQLVRYARICTSKLDFIDRLRRLSSRLHHQGFNTTALLKSFNKFFKCHGEIIRVKYDITLRELRSAVCD